MKNKSIFLNSSWIEKEKRIRDIYYFNNHQEPEKLLMQKLSNKERKKFIDNKLFRNTVGNSVLQLSEKVFENYETGEQVVMPWIETFELPIQSVKEEVVAQVHSTGAIICPECKAIAFVKEDTPKWMTSGYCFRCGQLIKWKQD